MIDRFVGPFWFLSNFWPCWIVDHEGLRFGSVEAAYQAAKSNDIRVREQFMALNPDQAKRLGRQIPIRPGWNHVRVDVMRALVRQKFNDSRLAPLLIATQDHELVEGNHWGDTFWGVCNGVGENQLGAILMDIRVELMLELANSQGTLRLNSD